MVQPVCDGDVSSVAQLGFDSRDGGPFYLAADCPDLRMQMTAPALRGDRVAYYKMVGTNLSKLTVTLAGGPSSTSGVTTRLRVCSLLECGRVLTRSSGGAAVNGELTSGDGIPANPLTLLVEAECTRAAGCSVQPDTIIRNLTLTVEDVTPPVVTLSNAWGNSPTQPWEIAADEYLYVNGDYGDSPNEEMWFSVDGGPENHTDCYSLPEDQDWVDCGIFDSANGMIKLPIFEGVITVTVFIRDAAGNVGSASAMVTNDMTAPAAPQGLSVGANVRGWINKYEFTATWSNPIAEGETSIDVAAAEYRIVDEWGNTVLPTSGMGVVAGDDIHSLSLYVPYTAKYTLEVRLIDHIGHEGPWEQVDFAYDSSPPVPPIIGWIPVVDASYVSTGLTLSWSDYFYWNTAFSGVCEYRTALNSLPRYEPVTGEDVTTVPVETKTIEITPSELALMDDGVHYFHVASTSCADLDGDAAHSKLIIDRKLPTVRSDSADGGWLAPGKDLVLRADDSDPENPYAGISLLTYSIDGGPEQSVDTPRASISLGQGRHTVTYYAIDIAGNRSATSTVRTGVDSEGPIAAFGAIDPADPALIRASVSDGDSGVDDAWIEYKSPGSPTWARLIGSSSGDDERVLQARFPDDDSLPSGEYVLRVIARDRAGNLSSTTTRVDGSPASLTLPLRRHPVLSLEIAPGPGKNPSNSLTVPFGANVEARGSLRELNGSPLAGASVVLSESISGGQRRQVGVVTTDGAGAFASRILSGPSRVLIASFRGDTLRGAANASATFNVRASVSLNRLPKLARSGKKFYLRGKVNPGRVPLPKGGARILIQHRSGSGWSGLFAEGRTASDGSFEIPWSQRTRGKSVRMKFRAAVGTEAGWPYATGYSQTRKIVVR